MRLSSVREWKDQTWTRLYEAALFEVDTVKLCTCLWNAQLAILSREREIQNGAPASEKERLALTSAMGILRNLRRLSGLDHQVQQELSPMRSLSARGRVRTRRIGTPVSA